MTALVVYDSSYGNTESVANAGAAVFGDGTSAVPATQASAAGLSGLDLLVVGSPTQGGRPTTAVSNLLAQLPQGGLQGTRVAAFDTRIAAQEKGFALRTLMKVIGYAAPRIARVLEDKGGRAAAPSEGFIVEDKEGPLREGELDRAAAWARSLNQG